jgi:hypothetical protein
MQNANFFLGKVQYILLNVILHLDSYNYYTLLLILRTKFNFI